VPAGARWRLRRALRRVAAARAAAEDAAASWEAAFFRPGSGPASLPEIEDKRRKAAHAYMAMRRAFASWPLYPRLSPVRYAIPDEEAVEARYDGGLRQPEVAYLPCEPLPAIEESRRMAGPAGDEYWLRFPSPVPAVGGLAWAHVVEPHGVRDPPSLVYGHGLYVELEMLDSVTDWMLELVRLGVRLVRLEAPWHNRRAVPGIHGGEPFLATLPLGALDCFAAEVRELAILIAWCRRSGASRVGVGGASLSALAGQLLASHARFWPARMRPDALWLATTVDRVGDLVFESSLAGAVGLPQALAQRGWTRERLARWHLLTDPLEEPALAARDIVMLLGQRDDVTPFAGGQALARRWRVPAENLFLFPQGHFSTELGLVHDPAPLRRLATVLKG
jgi:hypothetical protein